MKLKYVGPKELISQNGIDFKTGKDDKYVYINPAMQILKALSHDYQKNTIYHHDIEDIKHSDESILADILHLKPHLETICEKEIRKLKKSLEEEIDNTQNLPTLKQIEKDSYRNNLIIMKAYRMQRETNKIIYEHLIEILVDVIIEHKIKEVNTPFNERYWHILQTIQGELSNHHGRSIGSYLDSLHNDSITINLKINPIV